MSTTTTNFGWDIPQSSDLVKNGATAIAELGQDIDTTMVDLKGGTSGQVLSKATNTDMDFTWVTPTDQTPLTTKGDLFTFTTVDARLGVGTNGQVLTADSTASTGLAWATASGGSTNVAGKNAVLNSAFNVWQRGTSIAFAGSAAGAYTADRWYIGGTNANQALTVSRVATGDTTNLPFIQYATRCQRNSGQTGNGALSIGQSFESINSVPFAGKTVTMSFYARAGSNFSPTSNALVYKLVTGTGTDQNVQVTGYTGSADTISATATLTTTWQRFTTTATIPAATTELAVNFNWTTTGTASTNDYFEFTGVQVEIAGSASAYSPNTSTYQAELAACQRYYWRTVATAAYGIFSFGMGSSSTAAVFPVNFPTTMRTAPTVIDYSTLQWNDTTNGAAISALTIDNANPQMAKLNGTSTSITALRPTMLFGSNSTTAYLGLGAEL